MSLHKGQRVKTLTKTVGRVPRRGVVQRVEATTVEVRWSDGHVSILSDGALVPDKDTAPR
ncbi:MAG: hypothetical protein U9N78_07890 [Actinomycetota bacterium]|nr:hypothetical protein [Actinomycetota bacterium]